MLRARATIEMVRAEKMRRELEAERGKYLLAADAEAAWTRAMSETVLAIEQAIPDLSTRLVGLDDYGQCGRSTAVARSAHPGSRA